MIQRIVITVGMIILFLMVYKKEEKSIKGKRSKNTLQIIMIILFVPILILILDMWNFFDYCMKDIYNNLTERYDMLSFLGAYISVLVSSLLLIIITTSDREENTKIIQDAQRPYLDVRYSKLSKKIIENKKNENVVFFYKIDDMNELFPEEYVCLELINNGESVAIIDINNMQIEIQYVDMVKDKSDVKFETIKTLNPKINTELSRLSLGKGKSIYVVFLYKPFYKYGRVYNTDIIYSNITYKDLFNKKYIDECRRNEKGEQIVVQDNKEIGG